jgi:hypothetical protein
MGPSLALEGAQATQGAIAGACKCSRDTASPIAQVWAFGQCRGHFRTLSSDLELHAWLAYRPVHGLAGEAPAPRPISEPIPTHFPGRYH